MLNFAFIYCFIASFIFSFIDTFPVDETNFELTANLFEGDMILSTELQQLLTTAGSESKRKPRNVLIDKDYRWPNGIVYYRLSDKFSSIEIKKIYQAMHHIATNTCVRFQLASEQFDLRTFIFIRPSRSGCSAAVGYQDRGIQYINLVRMGANSIGCFRLGIIVHELLHALGIYHQHSSSDRDHYVRIRNENIEPGMEHNFRKLPSNFTSNFGVGYDYASVMHYSSNAFSRNGQQLSLWIDLQFIRLVSEKASVHGTF